jgi:cellulose synthase operon protein C
MIRPRLSLMMPTLALAMALGGLPAPALAQAPSQRDLQALVVYVQQGDQTSARAELRRLQARFPNWTPPSDIASLAQGQAGANEAPIWQAIERGDFAGARAGIAQLRAASPGWAPSNEMTSLLDLNEAQARFDRAVAERRAQEAITIYRTNPQILRCDRVNNAWLVAEMHHALGQTENALATYRGVIASCPTLDIVVPTLEKANDIATVAQLDALFTQARVSIPTAGSQFDALRARLVAGRGGAAPAAPAAARPAAPPPTAAVAPRPAAPQPAPPGIPAPIPAAAPPTVSGATALTSLPRTGDARITQVRAALAAGDHTGCLAASTQPRSVEVLYERSWCAYNLDRPREALAGFRVVAEASMPGDVPRDARFGLALAYLALNMTE